MLPARGNGFTCCGTTFFSIFCSVLCCALSLPLLTLVDDAGPLSTFLQWTVKDLPDEVGLLNALVPKDEP